MTGTSKTPTRWAAMGWGYLALAMGCAVAAGCSSEDTCSDNSECAADQVCVLGSCQDPGLSDSNSPDGFGTEDGSADSTDDVGAADSTDTDSTGTDSTGTDSIGTDSGDPDTIEDTGPDAEPDAIADATSDTTPDGADDATVDVQEDVSFDIVQPDITPPTVLGTTPGAGAENVAVPFVVTVQFSEAMRPETMVASTIYLVDVLADEVKISGAPQLSPDGLTVTLAPFPNTVKPTQPYRLIITTTVQDVAGNKLAQQYEATFYTGSPDPGELATLASLYAPVAHQALGTQPQFDYFTAFDYDGDLISQNNDDGLATAQEILPAVYWDAVETKSHIFLTYVFMYPLRLVEEGATPVINDTAGMTLVLQKFPSLAPVAAYTYGRKGSSQDLYAHAVTGGYFEGRPLVDETGTFEQLFEDGFFQLYLTSPRHQACSWALGGQADCQLNAGILLELKLATLAYGDGNASPITKGGDGWPGDGTEANYELIPLVSTLWPKRELTGNEGIWGATYDYMPQAGRPGGDLDDLPLTFHAPVGQAGGRPPWAWRWAPSAAAQFTDLPEGTFFLDPGHFLAKRHALEGDPFNSATGVGWSQDYCFHPYLGIDVRGQDADCPFFTLD